MFIFFILLGLCLSIYQFNLYMDYMFEKNAFIEKTQNTIGCRTTNTQTSYKFSRNEFIFIPLYNIIYSSCLLLLTFYCIYLSDYVLFLYSFFIQKDNSGEDTLILKKFLRRDTFYKSFITEKGKFISCILQLTLVMFIVNMFATFLICFLRQNTKERHKNKLKFDLLLVSLFTLLSTFAFFYIYI